MTYRRSARIAALSALLLTLTLATGTNAGGRPLEATLLGANEAPAPGDPDGSGTARVWLNRGQGEVCFEL